MIIWDLIKWADTNGIGRGTGRGSVGGSLLAYILDITVVDPLKHDLLFARFINPERNDYPDIDLDFDGGPNNIAPDIAAAVAEQNAEAEPPFLFSGFTHSLLVPSPFPPSFASPLASFK